MPNSELEHDDRERRLDDAAAKYFELHAAGQAGDRQQWLAQYPDLADELAEFLNDLDHVKSPVFSQSVAQVADPSDLFATTAYGSDSSSPNRTGKSVSHRYKNDPPTAIACTGCMRAAGWGRYGLPRTHMLGAKLR